MSIILYTGPMFSGKTRRLVALLEACHADGEPVLVVRPSVDTRGGDTAVLNCRVARDKPLPPTPILHADLLRDVRSYITQYLGKRVGDGHKGGLRVFVDEGQFFPDLAEECVWLAEVAGVSVAVAALNSDFMHRGWPQVQALMAVVDHIVWADDAICDICKKRGACYTQKRPGTDLQKVVDIGDSDKYYPICRRCAIKMNKTREPDRCNGSTLDCHSPPH